MLKMLVVSESKTRKQGAKGGQNFHENKFVQNTTQSMEKVKLQTEIMKIILDVENAGIWGRKQQWKRTNRGQYLHENYCVQNSTKSIEKVKSPTKIMKINLDIEDEDGLGVKKTMKKDKQGAKFTWKLMCPEFHQVNRKGHVTNRDYEN